MAKIGKIRFVNFTYNENRHIYDQILDFYNGEDTLLNLQNGGGKTVLVQMMMQPIIPKQKLKDRLFKNYFTNARAPVYIMIEWILDDRSQRVMTGIGIKRVAGKSIEDDNNSIRVVTFISEYEEGSRYDIKNITLTYEEKGMIKLIDFDRVVKDLSDTQKEGNDVWVYRWNTADEKREYARRLTEYKINPAEWKNLMVRINEAEAGLNSFFNDCKTNKALIKKWFVPTIEEQLNQSGDFIGNIKELMKNHAEQLVKNEDMITEREILEDFKRKSGEIVTSLEEYMDLLAKSDQNKWDLGNACVFIDESLKKLTLEKEEITIQIKQVEDKIKELEYQRLSHEYYIIEDELQQLNERAFHISSDMDGLKAELEQLEYQKNLLLSIKLKEDLTKLNLKITKFEAELEKEALQQEDVKNIINDIRFSLQEKYKEKILQLETVFEEEKIRLGNEENKLSEYHSEVEKTNRNITSLSDHLVHIRSRIGAFDESESALREIYHDFRPVRNMITGEYSEDSLSILKDGLDTQKADIEKSLQDIREKRLKNKNRLEVLERECKELRDNDSAMAVEKNKKESEYQLFQKEKGGIERIIRSYQLNEDWLFDKDKLCIPLYSEREKYQKLMNDIIFENAIYHKQMRQYESGKAYELSDDLKKIFDEHNIFVESGQEWLRNLQINKKEKQRLVKHNPFLPYALIVSQKDFELIKELELKEVLTPIIPIMEREKFERNLFTHAERAFSVKTGKGVFAIDDMNFLIPFNDRVLNKNYCNERCDEILSKIEKNNAMIETAQEAMRHIASDLLRIENFSFSRPDAEKLWEETKEISVRWEECTGRMAAVEEESLSVREMDVADSALQSDLEKAEDKFHRKQDDILGFMKKCGQYSVDLKEKSRVEEDLKRAAAFLSVKEEDIARSKRNRNEQNQKISNISFALEKERQQYLKYADAKSGKRMEDEIESLESRLSVYTSEISGKIQTLQDVLEDYRHQRADKQKTMEDYGIAEHLYIGREYNQFEYDKIKEESNTISVHVRELAVSENRIQFKIAERKSDLKYRMRDIKERCGCQEPMQREWIKDLDFEKEKILQKAALKDLEKKASQRKRQENHLQRVRFGLEEYRDFVGRITEPRNIEGDLEEQVLQLIKDFKKNAALVNDGKNRIAAHYIELENEFVHKAEIFKNLFHSILNGERRYQPAHALNAFNRVFMQIDRRLEQHSIDVKKMDDMEKYIIENTLSYLKNVYDEMNHIDRNSTIDLDGKRCKMLIIRLPEPDALDSISLKEYLKSTIANGVDLNKCGKSMDTLLDNEISTYNLFDRYVSVNKVEITLIKIEPNKLKKKTWRQVIAENSGGELFVSAFVVFISLLTYMRGENMLSTGMDSKVLIMDNPFGPITSEHLLKPLFEISKKYNTQMICLTDVKGHTIYDRFNLIYSLNIEREVGREDEYIELKTIKKDIQIEEDEILSASMFKIEDKSRFELVD